MANKKVNVKVYKPTINSVFLRETKIGICSMKTNPYISFQFYVEISK